MKLESTLVGVAGEYLVAGELTLRGYIASITLRNSRGIDIIASSADGSRSISIQVKTNSDGKPKWILNKKSEGYFSDNHFYVFVALQNIGSRPDFYIVPSQVVADYVRNDHATWLSLPKANGSPRKDSNMRKFNDPEQKYLEAWELLSLTS
ncbi:MAG: hypothetical protein ACI85U_001193 [Candidatus Promineifilaceae bacterium]|jgi:hypothetical protein